MESVFYCKNPIDRMRPPSELMQSLFQLCVVIGMDDDTGLSVLAKTHSRRGSNGSSISSEDDNISMLFAKQYEPCILAVLSGKIASFPQSKEQINAEPYYIQECVAVNVLGSSQRKPSNKLKFTKPVEVPLGNDVIFTLPHFCLPDGTFIYESKPTESVHTFVLTDIEGSRSYCSCLTFYKAYYVFEEPFVPGNFTLSVEAPQNTEGPWQICYVPTCCCLISKFPYFQIAKDCLSSFLPILNQPGRAMRLSLMQIISQLCLVPIPPPGPINIQFELCNLKHLVRSSGEPKKRIIDMEFHLPFLCFSVDNVLLLLTCILTQQKIVFLSSDYSLLTPVTEALLSYIQPLLWSLTYVPVLPSNLIDLLEAPGSFIMGCHSDHIEQVFKLLYADEKISAIVVAQIDTGEVFIRKHSMPKIPHIYADKFKIKIKTIQLHYDVTMAHSISLSDVDEFKKRRQHFNQNCANSILEACLELMLNLFSEFGNFIKGGDNSQQVLFDRVAFVDSKPEKDREFFKLLCGSHAFSTYLCERYEKDEVDFFSTAISENTTPNVHRKRGSMSVVSGVTPKARCVSSGKIVYDDDDIFVLTPFVEEGLHTGLFYQNCIKDLDALVESSGLKSSSRNACYLYLRGMMYVANGQIYEGLDDFFALSSKSVQMFPTHSIIEIITQLDAPALEKIKDKSYFRKTDLLLRKHKKVGGSTRVRKQLIFDGVPRNAVGKMEFIERVLLCQITENSKTAEHLFNALTADRDRKVIDPGTFSDIYETLNQADLEAQNVDIQRELGGEQEFVIKVSSLCKTDSGVGRLVLTNIRLLFMVGCGSSYQQLVRLLDIANIEKYQHYSVLPPGVQALRIFKKEKSQKAITACLKGERNIWYCYLKEMVVCHERAEALKDPQFISLGAQNVILTDVLIKSGLPESTASMMCYFTTKNEPFKEISGDTEKFLSQRLNPSEKDTTSTTVEALIYLPKDGGNGEQIWCGMGSGSIVIFKAGNTKDMWNYETQISCANDRVSCLLAIGKSRVWAGSFDATIYVIDRSCYKADQHLEEHSDYISAMILQDGNPSIVWSASLNGQIIGWDAETLTASRRINLKPAVRTFVSFVLVGKDFWCDVKTMIHIVDSEGTGTIKKTLTLHDKDLESHLTVDCMLSVSPTRVWCGCNKKGKIALFDTETFAYNIVSINSTESSAGLTKMAMVGSEVWVGNRNGTIYGLDVNQDEKIQNVKELQVKRTLKIHDDSVRSMCVLAHGFVATGPGSRDGKIAIWRVEEQTNEDLGFETIDHGIVTAEPYFRTANFQASVKSVNDNNNKKYRTC